MKEEQLHKLKHLKELQKQKLLLNEFIDKRIKPYHQEAVELNKFESFKIVAFCGIPEKIFSLLPNKLKDIEFLDTSFNLDLQLSKKLDLKLYNFIHQYKTEHPFYFIPSFLKINIPIEFTNKALHYCIKHFNLNKDIVEVFYMQNSIVMNISLTDLAIAEEKGVFNLQQDQVIIFSATHQFVLVQDIEEHWYILLNNKNVL